MHAAKVYHQSTAEPRNVSIILQPKASHLQIANYSLRPKINVVLAFKFCPTKSVVLACNEIHLITAIPTIVSLINVELLHWSFARARGISFLLAQAPASVRSCYPV